MWEILASQLASSAGPILVVLMLLSIAGLAVSIVKAVEFRRAGVGRSGESRSFASEAGRAPLLRANVLAAARGALSEAPPGPEGRERAGAQLGSREVGRDTDVGAGVPNVPRPRENVSRNVEKIAGRTRGTTMRRRIVGRDAPSSSADSSSCASMLRRAPPISMKPNGK